jgi:integrase
MVTVDKDDTGRPIAKLLKPVAYFPTYNAAYEALVEYNKDPYDLSRSVTMNELFNDWISNHKVDKVKSIKNIKCAWAYCAQIYDIDVQTVRARHIRNLLDNPYKTVGDEKIPASPVTTKIIKNVLNQLCDWGVKYELMTRNYAREITLDVSRDISHHKSFTKEEMAVLWDKEKDDFRVKMILFQCYMGWRPSELIAIRKENIDFENMTITGGMKTEAGKNRVVPIHSKVQDIFNFLLDASGESEWLFPSPAKDLQPIGYTTYKGYFYKALAQCGLDTSHTPHDGRKQFVTMAKEADVNEYAIKRIVGHSIQDLTENTYTDRSIEWLRTEIEKIK